MADIATIIGNLKADDLLNGANGAKNLYTTYLAQNFKAVSTAIIPYVIVAELTFTGVRIALGKTFVESFVEFTKMLIIAFIILQLQWPQQALIYYMDRLTQDGQTIGQEIAKKAVDGGSVNDISPAKYWINWLGVDTAASKFSPNNTEKYFSSGLDAAISDIYGSNAAFQIIQVVIILIGTLVGLGIPLVSWLGGIFFILFFVMILVFLAPMIFQIILTTAFLQAATCLMPALMEYGFIVACNYALYLLLAFGMITLPFMFFQSFNDSWKKYLTVATQIAITPCIFYIMAGIGFYIATDINAVLLKPGGMGLGAVVLDMVIHGLVDGISVVADAILDINGPVGKVLAISSGGLGFLVPGFGFGDIIKGIIIFFFLMIVQMFAKIIFWSAGAALVNIIVTIGCGIAGTAATVASGWNAAFSAGWMGEGSVFNALSSNMEALKDAVFKGVSQGVSFGITSITSSVSATLGATKQVANTAASAATMAAS
jgi:hypothetical protein